MPPSPTHTVKLMFHQQSPIIPKLKASHANTKSRSVFIGLINLQAASKCQIPSIQRKEILSWESRLQSVAPRSRARLPIFPLDIALAVKRADVTFGANGIPCFEFYGSFGIGIVERGAVTEEKMATKNSKVIGSNYF